MDIQGICRNYFNLSNDLSNNDTTTLEKVVLIALKIISYITVIIPLGFLIALGVSSLRERLSDNNSDLSPTEKKANHLFQNPEDISGSTIGLTTTTSKQKTGDGKDLKSYYLRKNITRGDEPVTVNIDSIDFSSHSSDVAKIQKLRKLTEHLVKKINAETTSNQQNLPKKPIQKRRSIYIDTHESYEPTQYMDTEPIELGKDRHETMKSFKTTKEHFDATFLGCIVYKLINMGLIYSYKTERRGGISIQA